MNGILFRASPTFVLECIPMRDLHRLMLALALTAACGENHPSPLEDETIEGDPAGGARESRGGGGGGPAVRPAGGEPQGGQSQGGESGGSGGSALGGSALGGSASSAMTAGTTGTGGTPSAVTELLDPPGTGDLCQQRFITSADGVDVEIPYCANVDLEEPGLLGGITDLVFVIHASERTARDHFFRARTAAELAGKVASTAIVAPQFLAEADIVSWSLGDTHLRWTETSWSSGSFSVECATCPPQLSSYEVLDRMIAQVLANATLPDLESIAFIGHSAGGQFVNRYAATSPFETERASVRYLATAPSSFVYFSELRPVLPAVDSFAVPDAQALAACPEYNNYRHGLAELYSYMRDLGVDGIRQRYAPRFVQYLVGSEDADPSEDGLSTTCPSLLQGAHRVERMRAYMHHLDQEFGQSVAQQRYAVVPGVGHNSADLYASDCGVAAIFDTDAGSCEFRPPGM